MKKRFICLLAAAIVFIVFFICSRALIFSYVNPYTNTSGFNYISKTIFELSKGFNYAKTLAKRDGQPFKYLFWNAYGSGFLKNNPIPNDLDFALGIDLGEYVFEDDNADVIAANLVDKMQEFQYAFNFYINTNPQSNLHSTLSPIELLGTAKFDKYGYRHCIEKDLKSALSGEKYIHYAKKMLEDEGNIIVDIPYLMNPHEILLEEYRPLLLFSGIVSYNDTMPSYMREITVMPEFFATINYKGKKIRVELVPESYLGARLQLSRRAFASNIFIGNFSVDFLKDLEFLKNDDEYLFYRMFTFRRHLQEVENIVELRNKPVKLFKRVMQVADSIAPVLDEAKYKEISEWVYANLSKPELQALNEYENICRNLLSITTSIDLYENLYREGKIQLMYNFLGETINNIEANNYVDAKTLKLLKDFYNNEMKIFVQYNKEENFEVLRKEIVKAKFLDLEVVLNEVRYKQIEKPEKIKEYLNLFESVYTDAGYHKAEFCYMDNKTVGVIKDDFTSKIKDLHKFALDNGLADLNYKLVNKSDVPVMQLCYDIWVRYNPSQKEIENYENLKKVLIEDKENFGIKKKLVFSF